MKAEEIDIYNEVDNFVEENEGEVTNTEIAQHFFELGRNNAINKACEWLYDHLYTRRDEQSPANHFVCSKQEMLTQTEFVEQFRKAMKGE